MKNRKKSLIFGIILLILCFGIGYAYLTTTLSINGTTDIDMNNWDVYFDNIQVTSGSVTGAQVIDAAEVVDDTTVSFHINLKEPGDFYEFTVDAKNDGTIDAMIESIVKKLNGVVITTLPAYLNYTVTYADDLEIEDNHLLAHESLETYKVRVEYKSDINPSDLPSSAQSLTLSFGVEYVQSDSNAHSVGHRTTAYSVNTTYMYVDQAVPDGVTLYSTSAEAMAAFSNNPFYLKHIIQDGVVVDSYVEFVVTPEMESLHPEMTAGTYSLIGGYVTYPYDNFPVLHGAFNSSHCSGGSAGYTCWVSGFYSGEGFDGEVWAGNSNAYCQVNGDGKSFCEVY